MRERFLRWNYHLIRHYAWWVLILSTLLSILALLYTFFIGDFVMRSSFLDLLPPNEPLLRKFEERESALRGADYLTILLTLKEAAPSVEEGIEKLKDAATSLVQRLQDSGEIITATFQAEVEIPQPSLIYASTEQLLELKDHIGKIRDYLASPAIEFEGKESLAEIYALVNEKIEEALQESGEGEATEDGLAALLQGLQGLDKLNKGVSQQLANLAQAGEVKWQIDALLAKIAEFSQMLQSVEGKAYLSRDKRSLLVNVRPRYSSQYGGIAYSQKITQLVRETIKEMRLEERGIEARSAGPYVLAADSDRIIKKDMSNTVIITAIGVALLFVLALGKISYPLLAIIPIFMSLSWTLAWGKASVGGFNLITSFLPSLIVGLGIDYGIQFITHYMEERRAGRRISQALEQTILLKGKAMLTASFTTAFALFGLLLANSRGLFEMGIIAGVGILLANFATLTVLPSLIIVSHVVLKKRFKDEPPRYRLNLQPAIHFFLRWRKSLLILTLSATLFMILPASGVKFQFVPEKLIPANQESQVVTKKIKEEFELGVIELGDFFVFLAKSPEEMMRITHELRQIAMIEDIRSIASLLPPDYEEKEKILGELEKITGELERGATKEVELIKENLLQKAEIVTQIRELMGNLSSLQLSATLLGLGEIAVELSSSVAQLASLEEQLTNLDAAQVSQNLDDLMGKIALLEPMREALSSRPQGVKQLIEALPESVRNRFVYPSGEFIIYARLKSGLLYQPEYYRRFIKEIDRISDDYLGYPMIRDRLQFYMQRDFWLATAIALLAILALLWSDFSRAKYRKGCILAMLPLVLGYIWMLGAMRLSGLTFSFTNIIISPLIIGLGVDNGVYLLHRHLDLGRKVERAVASTGLAILVTSLAVMISFGSLLFAQTPGLVILGESALFGIGFNVLFSLTFLPALLARN